MFCHIPENWRGRGRYCREVVVNLIPTAYENQDRLRIRSTADDERITITDRCRL